MSSGKIYGVADKAWQVVVGCSPSMPCAPRCWARKTVARVVECQTAQHPERAEFFQVALTPDKKKWSGEVRLDMRHLTDPLRWRKPALIATGSHGDWGRLPEEDKDRIFAVMALCPHHRFMPLTKQPADVLRYFADEIPLSSREELVAAQAAYTGKVVWDARGSDRHAYFGCGSIGDISNRRPWVGWPLRNATIGCSVMNQAEADKYLGPMAAIAAMGWATHVWHEPATGPVNWVGWEFLRGAVHRAEWDGSEVRLDCFLGAEMATTSSHCAQFPPASAPHAEPLKIVLTARLAA